MAEQLYIPKYTIEDYLLWKGDWELWNGIPVAMSPSPVSAHSKCCCGVIFSLRLALRECHEAGCGHCSVYTELDWHIDTHTVVRPDVAISCGPVGKFLGDAPSLIVEVLSDKTRKLDLNERRELYEQEGVHHYFVVDPKTNDVMQWTNGGWETVTGHIAPSLDHDCTINWDLGLIFE